MQIFYIPQIIITGFLRPFKYSFRTYLKITNEILAALLLILLLAYDSNLGFNLINSSILTDNLMTDMLEYGQILTSFFILYIASSIALSGLELYQFAK